MQIYCIKCKSKKEVKEYETITTKNNRRAAKAVCPDCGTKIMRFIPTDPLTISGEVIINAKKDGK